jgi:uncharacterized protein (DUF305 family)
MSTGFPGRHDGKGNLSTKDQVSGRMQCRTLVVALLFALPLLSISRAQTAHEHKSSTNGIEAGSFTVLMAQAMERMHKDMSIAPSGDPDRDFAAMMIPHHRGAVDMAKAELQFGKNPVLRRLAQGIIIEQLQEIEVMQRELQQLSAAPKEH